MTVMIRSIINNHVLPFYWPLTIINRFINHLFTVWLAFVYQSLLTTNDMLTLWYNGVALWSSMVGKSSEDQYDLPMDFPRLPEDMQWLKTKAWRDQYRPHISKVKLYNMIHSLMLVVLYLFSWICGCASQHTHTKFGPRTWQHDFPAGVTPFQNYQANSLM